MANADREKLRKNSLDTPNPDDPDGLRSSAAFALMLATDFRRCVTDMECMRCTLAIADTLCIQHTPAELDRLTALLKEQRAELDRLVRRRENIPLLLLDIVIESFRNVHRVYMGECMKKMQFPEELHALLNDYDHALVVTDMAKDMGT